MPIIQHVGKKCVTNYKFLGEICKNLKNFGVGRLVYNASEAALYKEPCYYILKSTDVHMACEDHNRSRVSAERILRGKSVGIVNIQATYLPIWVLINKSDEHMYLKAKFDEPEIVKIDNVCDYPPTLGKYIRKNYLHNQFNPKILMKPFEKYMDFKSVNEPSEQDKAQIFPPYETVAADGLVIKKPTELPFIYYIKSRQYHGIKFKVYLKEKGKVPTEDQLEENAYDK